jgi:hypothetical protein
MIQKQINIQIAILKSIRSFISFLSYLNFDSKLNSRVSPWSLTLASAFPGILNKGEKYNETQIKP